MEKYNNWKLKFYTIWAGQDVYKRQHYNFKFVELKMK